MIKVGLIVGKNNLVKQVSLFDDEKFNYENFMR
jgi:hypothetical protein